jgi:cellulose synthase/poly-beta-1,6-N-acetylglucosamine synthase-like glycosyltransferase
MLVLLLLCVFGVLLVLYVYLGYPLLLRILPCRATKPGPPASPSCAILLSVYNEEHRVGEKLRNFAALSYPASLELWIGSDGSTDQTAGIVRNCADPRVHLLHSPQRCGKTAVLNRLAAACSADLLIFTDVNSMFARDAVSRLAARFCDPRVGLVSGRTISAGEGTGAATEGLYYRFENWLKQAEAAHGCLTSADGAIYAIRHTLYHPLPPDLINDFAHGCEVILQGFRAVFAPDAICCEEAGESDPGREFDRQTRMTAQAVHVYLTYIGRLLALRRIRFVWMLTSHKTLRWCTLAGLAASFAAMLALGAGDARWLWAAASGVVLILLFLLGALFSGRLRKLAGMGGYFLMVHAAYLRGLWKFASGERYVTWKPRAG